MPEISHFSTHRSAERSKRQRCFLPVLCSPPKQHTAPAGKRRSFISEAENLPISLENYPGLRPEKVSHSLSVKELQNHFFQRLKCSYSSFCTDLNLMFSRQNCACLLGRIFHIYLSIYPLLLFLLLLLFKHTSHEA